MNDSFRLFPEAASKAATEVDYLSLALLAICTVFSLGIFLAITFFGFRYWHTRNVNREFNPSRAMHWFVESLWSLGPLAILIVMFVWGAAVYIRAHQPPKNPLEVNVVAKQWMWKIAHPGGRREINTLHVPTGRPVRLTMISEDVIHSFFVPAFRAKQDVLPGRYSTFWFEATRPGIYHLFCAEYCGTSHSQMIGQVFVQSPQDYARWIALDDTETAADRGRRHLMTLGCVQCHQPTGDIQTGPTLTGVFGASIPLGGNAQNGEQVIIDAAYVRESILNPQAKLHLGFSPDMPSYEDQITPEQIMDIVAYLRSVQ